MIERKVETAHDVLEDALEHTFLMPDEKWELRERLGHALLIEALRTVDVLNAESALEVEPEKPRRLGSYIAMLSLPSCLFAYVLFFYFGPWAIPAFLIPAAMAIVGAVIDDREEA